jgi:acyl-CoA dehydrogenase
VDAPVRAGRGLPARDLDRLTYDQVRVADPKPLQEEVKAGACGRRHLPPELGGMGFGQVKLGLMHEILGQSPYGPVVFGNNAPTRATPSCWPSASSRPATRSSGSSGCSPCWTGRCAAAFSMTEPGAGADPTMIATTAVRDGDEWVINGHKWFTTNGSVADFLIVMAVTNPDVHPYQGCSMIIVPADTPGVDIVRDVATMEDPVEHYGKFGGPRRDHLPRGAGPGTTTWSAKEGEGSCWPRSGWGPAASTTACAGWASPGGPSTCCASGPCPAPPTGRCWPRSRPSRTGWPTPWPR